MSQLNDDWLAHAVFSSEVASLERAHVVLVQDPALRTVDVHGPFATGVEACQEAELIVEALHDDEGILISPLITVIALTPPPPKQWA